MATAATSRASLVAERIGPDEYYYAFDGLGSVIALIDATGTQRAAYSYDPYGGHATATALNGALPPNPWRYAGGALDSTGLYHFGARYYDPAIGRWTQQDSIVSLGNPGNANRYAYAGDDPVNFVDPSGLKGCLLLIRNSKGCLGGSIDDSGKNLTRALEGVFCGTAIVGAATIDVETFGLATPVLAGAAGCLAAISSGEAENRLGRKRGG